MAETSDEARPFKLDSLRGTPGYFRVGQREDGGWSLLDPTGRSFFATVVNAVLSIGGTAPDPGSRLRGWGFNTLGAGGAPELRDEGLIWMASVNFIQSGPVIVAAGIRLPDVFDLAWPATAHEWAERVCAPFAERADLLGWVTDENLGWGSSTEAARPSLLQTCLSLEPSYAAYHAAWEFVLAPHRGQLERLAKAWASPIENKEVVRALTRSEQGISTRGYWKDNSRWTREFAQRYFAATATAIRAADPHHLLLGLGSNEPVRPGVPTAVPGVVVESILATADVPWVFWHDLAGLPPGPVLAAGFSWVSSEFWLAGGTRARGTAVERMLRRGRTSLRRLIAHPAVVGYAWRQWTDLPGEQPPFAGGLIHLNGAEAREHTELVADINRRIHTLRPSL